MDFLIHVTVLVHSITDPVRRCRSRWHMAKNCGMASEFRTAHQMTVLLVWIAYLQVPRHTKRFINSKIIFTPGELRVRIHKPLCFLGARAWIFTDLVDGRSASGSLALPSRLASGISGEGIGSSMLVLILSLSFSTSLSRVAVEVRSRVSCKT